MNQELNLNKKHVQGLVKLQLVEGQTVSLQNINQLHSVQQVQHQLYEVIQAFGRGHVLNLMVLKTVVLTGFLSRVEAVEDSTIRLLRRFHLQTLQTFVNMEQWTVFRILLGLYVFILYHI